MEAKKTKILALAVLAMLCAVAIVGAAYAAFAGTAKTYNAGNNATAGYIEIENASFSPMINSVSADFDTFTYESGKAWFLQNPAAQPVDSKTAKAIGDLKSITVNNKTGAPISKLAVTVKTSADVGNNDFVYFMAVTVGSYPTQYISPVSAAGTTLNFDLTTPIADNGDVAVTFQLYIGYVADVWAPNDFMSTAVDVAPHDPGFVPGKTSTAGPVDLTNVTFGITVAVPAA